MVCGISDGLYKGMNKGLSWIQGGCFTPISELCPVCRHFRLECCDGSDHWHRCIAGIGEERVQRATGLWVSCRRRHPRDPHPPSGTMIVYGMLADTSVGRLFAGGVIPGIIMAICFMAYIYARVVRNLLWHPGKKPLHFGRFLKH